MTALGAIRRPKANRRPRLGGYPPGPTPSGACHLQAGREQGESSTGPGRARGPQQEPATVALGYIRRSKESGARTISLEDQRARIADYCGAQGWTLVEVLADDGVSGAELNRLPEGERFEWQKTWTDEDQAEALMFGVK